MSPVLRSIATLLPLLLWSAEQEPAEFSYEFTLDGESVSPEFISMSGDGAEPRAGDVVVIGAYRFVLDEPGLYRLRGSSNGSLLRDRANGASELLVLKTHIRPGEPEWSDLAPHSWSTVRGWSVGCQRTGVWHEGLDAAFAELDRKRCLVTLSDRIVDDFIHRVPQDLRYLELPLWDGDRIPVLAGFEELRFLELWGVGELDNLTWSTGLKELRYLDISGTRVSDLSPLSGHPNLREINAGFSPIKRLPNSPLPNLRSMDLMASGVSSKKVDHFRKLHPTARVTATFREALMRELKTATGLEIRVRKGRQLDEPGETLHKTTGLEEVHAFLDMIHVDESYRGQSVIGTTGECLIRFHDQDSNCLAELSFVASHVMEDLNESGGVIRRTCIVSHPGLLRVRGVWPAHARLLPRRAIEVEKWLEARGVRINKDG